MSSWKKEASFASLCLLVTLLTALIGVALHGLVVQTQRLVGTGMTVFHAFCLIIIGMLAAIFWYWSQKNPRKLYKIKDFLEESSSHISVVSQIFHILLQVILVGFGSPVGKEVAPRELGALLADRISERYLLTSEDRRDLVAIGVATGLSAIYQVPFAAFCFPFETLGMAVTIRKVCYMGVMTFLASYFASYFLGNPVLYGLPLASLTLKDSWLLLPLLFFITPLASIFSWASRWASQHRLKDLRILVALPMTLVLVVLVAFFYPQILGNGELMAKYLIQSNGEVGILPLLLFKISLLLLMMWSGAYGGTLTPSFAIGLALAMLLFQPFSFSLATEQALWACGALIFLANSMKAPLTAFGLVIVFTGISFEMYPMLLLSLGLSILFRKIVTKKGETILFLSRRRKGKI